jgi:hypothetical protein
MAADTSAVEAAGTGVEPLGNASEEVDGRIVVAVDRVGVRRPSMRTLRVSRCGVVALAFAVAVATYMRNRRALAAARQRSTIGHR